MDTIIYKPIGIIRTPFNEPKGTPIQPLGSSGEIGEIEIFKEYSEGLKDIEGFSHIILIFHMHLNKSSKLMVMPFLDTAERGVFATRAPARPNQIGFSVVELIDVNKNFLKVKGIDIINETPLLDIKPFVKAFDVRESTRNGWLEESQNKLKTVKDDGRFAEKQ